MTSMKHQDHKFTRRRALLEHSLSTRGVTLMELIVTIALVGILGGVGATIFAMTNKSYNRANAVNRMQSQGSQVLEVLHRSIRSSTVVSLQDNTAPTPNNNCNDATKECILTLTLGPGTIDNPTGSAACSQVVYRWIPSSATSPFANGRLTRIDCGGAAVDLFDVDTRQGVSIERTTGTTPVFSVTSGTNTQSVVTKFTLLEGVQVLPLANRTKIDFGTTTALRSY